MFGSTDFKQGSAGSYNWILGGSTATDVFEVQTAAATSVLEVRGSNIVTCQTGSIQVGTAVDNTTIKIRATSSTTNNPVQENANSGANSIAYRATGSATSGSVYGFQANNTNSSGTVKAGFVANISGAFTANNNLAMDVQAGHFKFATSGGSKIGTGTTQLLSFWNATPIVQPAAMTSQLTNLSGDITPSTPDYALTATNGGWGCGSQDEFETMTSVIENLQTRVQELEDALSAAAGGSGLIA